MINIVLIDRKFSHDTEVINNRLYGRTILKLLFMQTNLFR